MLAIRIVEHDARVNAARFANWVEDEQLAAVELGRRLGDDPEAAVAQLKRTSAGCDWLIGRWRLLGNGLSTAEEGGPDCSVDRRRPGAGPGPARPAEGTAPPGRVAGLAGVAPRRGPVGLGGSRGRIAGDHRDAGRRAGSADEEVWEEIEQPRLRDWQAGVEIDLGAEGTRLRRYEAAADRLFRSAWRKLERLRKERGEPLMPRTERGPAPEPAARATRPRRRPPPAPPPAAAPARPEAVFPELSLLGDPAAPVLDFWVGGPPRPGMNSGNSSRDKTNPAPGRHAKGGRAGLPGNLA